MTTQEKEQITESNRRAIANISLEKRIEETKRHIVESSEVHRMAGFRIELRGIIEDIPNQDFMSLMNKLDINEYYDTGSRRRYGLITILDGGLVHSIYLYSSTVKEEKRYI